MLKIEKKLCEFCEKHVMVLTFILISVAGLLVRIPLYPFISGDMEGFLIPWYEVIKSTGRIHGLAHQVGNYNVLYQTLIALMTYFPFDPVVQYKSLSVLFDYLLAAFVAWFTYGETERDIAKTVTAYGLVLLSPAVIMNSAMWGQCDSMYVTFLVATLLFFSKKKYPLAFAMFGLAMAFKLQAIFLLPFLLFAYVRKKEFSILQFLIIPLMMEVVCIPAMFVGRGIKAAFSVYYYQTKSCTKLFFSYPSFWAIFVDHTSGKVAAVEYMRTSIVLLTVMVLAGLMVYLIRQKVAVEGENVLYIGFLMIYTCVLFLPGMHDRYGYGYEILALPIALKHKKTIPLYLGLMFLDLVIYGQEFFDGLDVGRTMGLANTVIYLLYVYYLTRVMLGRRDTSK